MERAVPVRKPHTSTADLLTWSATGPDAPAGASPAASSRPSLKVRCCRLPDAAALVCWFATSAFLPATRLTLCVGRGVFCAAGRGDHAGDVRRTGERAGGRGSEQEVRSGGSPPRIRP